jgi:OOP family OmpA-OmpF porin
MNNMARIGAALAVIIQLALLLPASAQTIGFAEAIDRVAAQCRKDIEKFCKTVNLGGGRMLQCLGRSAGVSAQCKTAQDEVQALLARRMQGRQLIPRVCDTDIRRLCAGVQPGDGNLMECFYKAKSSVSSQCQRAVADAGYE